MPSTQNMNRNDALHQLLKDATGIEPVWTGDAGGNRYGWLRLDAPEQLKDAAGALAGKTRLCTVTAYAEERDDPDKRRRIAYHFASGDTVIMVVVPLFDAETLQKLPVPSITPWFLNADWNEREFMEMFNIEVVGHPNPRRLFLDERLDAGVMTKLIPFSAMAHGAASNTLWERVLEAKGVPLEERMPSLAVPAEPIKAAPVVTPVASAEPRDETAAPTLAALAAPVDAARAGGDGVPKKAGGTENAPAAETPEKRRAEPPKKGAAKAPAKDAKKPAAKKK